MNRGEDTAGVNHSWLILCKPPRGRGGELFYMLQRPSLRLHSGQAPGVVIPNRSPTHSQLSFVSPGIYSWVSGHA